MHCEYFASAEAWEILQGFRADARVQFVPEPSALEQLWKKLAVRNAPSLKLWMDVYLAAFALAGRYRFITFDKAFNQFRGLDPLILS